MSTQQNNTNNNNRRQQNNSMDKAYTKSKDKSREANKANELQGDHVIKMSSKKDQNPNYVINYMNRAAKLLLGYEPEQQQQEQKEGEQQQENQRRSRREDSKVEKVDTVIISAAEQVISDALRLAALIRNKIPNLHQNIEIKTNEVKDVYESKFQDAQLDDVVKERKITIVRITLTRSEAVIKNIKGLAGYQEASLQSEEPQVKDLIRFSRRRNFNNRRPNTYAHNRNNNRNNNNNRDDNRRPRNNNNRRNNYNDRNNSQGRSNSNVRNYDNNNNRRRYNNNNRKQSGDQQEGGERRQYNNNNRRYNNNNRNNNNNQRNQNEGNRRQNAQRNHNGQRQNQNQQASN